MDKLILVLTVSIALMLLLVVVATFFYRKNKVPKKYKGMIFFDIDGTLATGKENKEIVDYCLSKGLEVGVLTASSKYTTQNLHTFEWMPPNLYELLTNNHFRTFSSIAGNVVGGVYNPSFYAKAKSSQKYQEDMEKCGRDNYCVLGWMKGYVMEKMSHEFGISDMKCVGIADDNLLVGIRTFNPDYFRICGGEKCGEQLTLESVKKQLRQCPALVSSI